MQAVRDPMYDGHPIEEPCAVVLRLAPTFFRFGSFEIFKPAPSPDERAGPSVGLVRCHTQRNDRGKPRRLG